MKTNRAINIILFCGDNYAVVKETLMIKHGTKEVERRAIEMNFVNDMAGFLLQLGEGAGDAPKTTFAPLKFSKKQ